MSIKSLYVSAARVACVPVAVAVMLGAASHAEARKPARHSSDFACAEHVAFGEARGKGRREQAIVVNSLRKNAALDHLSLCAEAHKRYQPKAGSTPETKAAVNNVLNEGATLVPVKFVDAIRFRAPSAAGPNIPGLRRVGQATPGGNVFYRLQK